ncbi:TOM1-like protein 2 isoform X1 [Hetaerina americana]|uniref:TOM1-like protein 2 isoform X1 n=2 Tax=Hetaerina americana TaxID=62018 RepID=UPI003A7F5069
MTINMSFFGGNPFATPVGQRIEQATDASLASENWALNMEVCDIVNDTEDGPKDAIKAIRKRLQQNAGKNYTVFMYTLTVLETCVKNCGMRFRILACNKEFILDLTRLIGPKYDPPRAVQDKVLSLIQSWSDAFSHLPDLAGVTQVYHDLRQKGIEFPMTDLDSMAPIHTPQRSVPEPEIPIDRPTEAANLAAATGAVIPGAGVVQPAPPHPQVQAKPPAPAIVAATPGSPTAATATLSPEQLAKLRSELEVVQGNAAVLNEMMAEMEPGKEHPSDLQLLQELYSTCRAMQTRLVDLIGKVAHDELTADLLRINDQLNNLFLRYGRFVKNREAGNQAAAARQEASKEADESLIDLSEEAAATPLPAATGGLGSKLAGLSINSNNVTSQLSRISSVPAQHGSQQRGGAEGGAEGGVARGGAVSGAADDTEFDMFAQSRNVTYESSKAGGSTYKDNLDPDQTTASLGSVAQTRSQPVARESDFREMEAWLQDRPEVAEESLTSSEFERFLAERAAAAEALPTVPAGVAAIGGGVAGSTSSGVQGARRRQKEGGEEEAASLFAL